MSGIKTVLCLPILSVLPGSTSLGCPEPVAGDIGCVSLGPDSQSEGQGGDSDGLLRLLYWPLTQMLPKELPSTSTGEWWVAEDSRACS